ncbi:MAG: 2,3-bisphosphoglycerate-independent phosphoglycerate mutase [Bdellovibrionota bacterium]
MPKNKPLVLCILDGFGLNPNPDHNAVKLGQTPNFDKLFSECPSNTLVTYGERVGLPEGQMGNSEVGHMNIGAGRVVEQWLMRIGRELRDGSFQETESFKNFIDKLSTSSSLHLVGLYSDGGVHSHCEHLELLLPVLARKFPSSIYLHIITDGRDTAPEDALRQVSKLEERIKETPNVKIASISGRFYAMDRDTRWDRTEAAYKAIVNGDGQKISSATECLEQSYRNKITDEFVIPAVIDNPGIDENSAVLFWNFREDRMRQIVNAVTQVPFEHFTRIKTLPKNVLCFTEYQHEFSLPVLFNPLEINLHLGEVVSASGLTQLRVAETEKYPHVTYFTNLGIEKPYLGEERKLVPSPRDVPTYDHKPEMSAEGVCKIVLDSLSKQLHDLIIVNFANCDMLGHTGILEAAIVAVEKVDSCLGRIVAAVEEANGEMLIIADHGNAEQMLDYETGNPHTAHTTHPVPVILFSKTRNVELRSGGALCDVAPTVLELLGLPKPKEMTGQSLLAPPKSTIPHEI